MGELGGLRANGSGSMSPSNTWTRRDLHDPTNLKVRGEMEKAVSKMFERRSNICNSKDYRLQCNSNCTRLTDK